MLFFKAKGVVGTPDQFPGVNDATSWGRLSLHASTSLKTPMFARIKRHDFLKHPHVSQIQNILPAYQVNQKTREMMCAPWHLLPKTWNS